MPADMEARLRAPVDNCQAVLQTAGEDVPVNIWLAVEDTGIELSGSRVRAGDCALVRSDRKSMAKMLRSGGLVRHAEQVNARL